MRAKPLFGPPTKTRGNSPDMRSVTILLRRCKGCYSSARLTPPPLSQPLAQSLAVDFKGFTARPKTERTIAVAENPRLRIGGAASWANLTKEERRVEMRRRLRKKKPG